MLWKSIITAALMMSLASPVVSAEKESTVSCIVLEGTPAEVGRAFAELNGEKSKADFERFAKEHPDLLKTGQTYYDITKKLAPHWLEEATAVAREIDVDPRLFSIYLGAKYRAVNATHECVSYAAAAKITKNGKVVGFDLVMRV